VSRCQNTGARGNSANFACAVIQQPTSTVRSLTGLQICAQALEAAARARRRQIPNDNKGFFISGFLLRWSSDHSRWRSGGAEYVAWNSRLKPKANE